jgi:hypothetical protein
MSLTIAAQHLASKGRGPDTELVHMTKGEIKGLRQLAMAQGGDLSINPYTGLVEAGFLSKILPMVAMAAATYFTAGAAAPAFATALQGTALAGSSGLLAGAASGALIGGLGAGLQGGNVGKGALFGGIGGAITGGMGGYESAPNVFSGMGDTSNALAQSGAQAGNVAATTGSTLEAANQAVSQGSTDVFSGLAGQPSVPPGTMPPGLTDVTVAPTQAGINAANMAPGEARNIALNKLDPSANAFGQAPGINAEQAMFKAENLARPTELGDIYRPITETDVKTQMPGSGSYYSGLGTGTMDTAKKAAILGAPGILAQGYGMTPEQQTLPTGEEEPSTLSRISPNFRAQEPAQPNPYYTAQETDYVKRPYGYAMGGIANSEFNQKDSDNPQTNYVGGGMPMYAGGGAIAFANRGIVQPLPRSSGADVGTYTDTDPNTAKLDAYNAALYRFNKARAKAGIKQPAEIKKAAVLGDVKKAAKGGIMQGHSDLGSYSDGGRMLKGPGDGMSDSIPGVIGKKQPARLADGEFVVPADVVSHLGNGSTDAGARKLYSMMDKIRKARTGKKKQAPQVKTDKYLPA